METENKISVSIHSFFHAGKKMVNNKEETTVKKISSLSFSDAIYNEISSAIGTNNSNQFLCLQIPGTILNADDYKYDYKGNASKPLIVEANESRLANKMFDPCKITKSDNGFSLAYQYESALSTLTPKLNKQTADFKNKLRQLLLSEYPYDFGDGNETKYTLQQVYFRLYDDYIKALNEWSKIQSSKKEELQKKYTTRKEFKEAYIEWYEIEAEKHIANIDEKKSKILAVFSPNDMKILEGVLDSGTGAELQEARNILKDVRKLTPTGGKVYPVRFVPSNWFEMIGTSFTPNDLMKSPEDLFSDLQNHSLRRMQLCDFIQSISSNFKNYKNTDIEFLTFINLIKEKQSLLNIKEELLKKTVDSLTKKQQVTLDQANDIKKIIAPISDIHATIGYEVALFFITKEVKKYFSKKISTNQKKIIYNQIVEIANIRKEYIDAINDLIKKIEIDFKKSEFHSYNQHFSPIINQLKSINEKIVIILEQIKYGINIRKNTLDKKNSIIPIPNGFTQITIDSIKNAEFISSDNSFFNKINNELLEKSTISITMNVAKIGIERDWFNPGIFALTKNMIKLGSTLISPKKDYNNGFDQERFDEMSKCIFPCYPVAMVIARDISITFNFNEKDSLSEHYKFIEKTAMSRQDFLMFQNKSGNSTIKKASSHVSTEGKSIVVRIDSTQLIGYCLEATRADKSDSLESLKKANEEKESEQASSSNIKTSSQTNSTNVPPTNGIEKKIKLAQKNFSSPLRTLGVKCMAQAIPNQDTESHTETKNDSKKEKTNVSSISDFVSGYQFLIEQSIFNTLKH